METLVFVRVVAHLPKPPDTQLQIFDPRACSQRTVGECLIQTYDSCRIAETTSSAPRDGITGSTRARCELMDRWKAQQLNRVLP